MLSARLDGYPHLRPRRPGHFCAAMARGLAGCGLGALLAVAREALRIYDDENIVAHVRAMEPHFLGGLRELLDHPLVGEVRGAGLVAGVELVKEKTTGEAFDPADAVGPFCNDSAEDHGLIVRAIGDTISFCPPLIISKDEIAEMLARFRQALDDTLAMVQERGLQ